MNFHQIIGIITGVTSGIVWEIIGTSPFKNIPTITPSLIIKLNNKNFHLHHWPVYLLILLIIIFWSTKTARIFHPSVLMIISFLSSAITYNIIKFSDWYIFVK